MSNENALASAVALRTLYTFQHFRNGEQIDVWEKFNLVPNEGINYLLGTGYNAETQIGSWYLFLMRTNYTPVATSTGALITGAGSDIYEFKDYTGNRPLIAFDTAAGQSVSNTTTSADFTIDTALFGFNTIWGGGIIQAQTKGTTGAGNGKLVSLVNLGAGRVVQTGDIIKATVSISATSV
jgi:hypothetical protein